MKLFLRNYFLLALITLLTLFSCVEKSTTDSNSPPTPPQATSLAIDYGISGNFYIALTNTALELIQKGNFGSQSNFSISPTLPNGLSLDITNGNISGTPTNFNLPIPYTVTATADSKTYTNIISLGVAPSQVWVTNTNSLKTYELTAFVVGDLTKQTEISWSSSDFSLATVNNNGVVGLKTSSTGGNVDIIATTADGNTGKITFNIFSAYIDYGTSNFYIALINNPIDLIQNSVLNNPIFSVNPALPSGLTLDTTNGNINGTPTAITPPSQYTVKATVDGRAQTKVISLGIAPSQIWVTNANSVNPYQLTAYVVGNLSQQTGVSWRSSDTSLATVDNNGLVDLKISPVRGTVEITATKGSNTDKVTFNVSSTSIDYGTNDFYIALVNNQINLIQNSKFNSSVFSINPTLPNGLTLDTTSGNISGSPTVVTLPSEYMIIATVDSRSQTNVVSLGVAPSVVWVTNTNTNTSNPYLLTAFVVGNRTKQTGIGWSSSDTSLATVDNNGVVNLETYSTGGDVEIIATTTDGDMGKFSFNVPNTSMGYGASNFYIALINSPIDLIQNSKLTNSTFSVKPTLPNGLTLDTTSGNISGSPTVVMLPSEYTVTATKDSKTYTKAISLGVAPSVVWVNRTNLGNPYQLTAYVVGDRSQQTRISWSSSDETLATVNDGVVSFKPTTTQGTVVVYATKGIYSNGVSLRVYKVEEVKNGKIITDGRRNVNLIINSGTKVVPDNQFTNKGLTSVVIPDGVTNIGVAAFQDNRITSVIIPNSVTTISGNAFQINLLTNVIIPNSVTTIGVAAFYNNRLMSVIIGNGVTTIENQAFANNRLTNVTIGSGVTNIGVAAFANSSLTSVIIPNRVTTIGRSAFLNGKLMSVVIPDSVTTIDSQAFNLNPNLVEVSLKQSLYTKITNTSSTNAVFGTKVTNYIKRP